MEHCIVYFSTWREPFKEQDLVATLERNRQRNAVDGITSVTLYVRGHIVQVLEGQKTAVEALYARIQQDHQHTNVQQVLSRPIQQRLFAGSSLGYETITTRQLDELKGVMDLEHPSAADPTAGEPLILRLIKAFYESNRHN